MLPDHLCFPKSWIGKEPVKVSDSVYYIGNDSTKQIILPSGYGKGVYAKWLSNGALRIDTDTNGTKLFFVGSQRFFPAYGGETVPHEKERYEEAVKECQHSQAEESKGNTRQTIDDHSNGSQGVITGKSKNSSGSGIGTILGGAGAFFAGAKKAAEVFKSIDDSSGLEADLTEEYQNLIERRQRQMAESRRRAAEHNKRMLSNEERREKELLKLRALEAKIDAKNHKKRIFSNLHNLFIDTKDIIIYIDKKDTLYKKYEDLICKNSGISSYNHRVALSRVIKGFLNSYQEVGLSETFIQCWSEIIYLIEEGVLFKDENVEYFTPLINNVCRGVYAEGSQNNESFESFLKMCYSQLKDAYWGYDFNKNPKEDKIRERIEYLTDNIFFEEDMDDGEFEEAYDLYEDEDNQSNDNIEGSNDEKDDEGDDVEDDDVEEETSSDNQTEEKGTLSSGKYPDLECIGFSKDNSTEDFREPKNVLDIITKSRNKKIAKKKEKWNDALWNFDHRLKKSVLDGLLNIEKDIFKLLKLEEEMNNLTKNGHSSGFFGFGGSKELKKIKTDIKVVQDAIGKEQTELARRQRELRYCERDVKDLQEELFELTQLEKYADFKPLEGKGISMVEQLVNCKKITDTQMLRNLFGL